MDQKLTEEQQRSAHKIIVANRGNCANKGNYLNCWDCPRNFESPRCAGPLSTEFQAENLRRSQAWLDAHITDAEIMAESPQEFCERTIRTEGYGKCKGIVMQNKVFCNFCVGCFSTGCFDRAKAYLASHPATPQEPPKRRPTPEEMVVGATVRVRLWDELVRDGKLDWEGDIFFQKSSTFFFKEKQESCGTTHKIIKSGDFVILEGCKDWKYTAEMLDYVEPEKVVKSEPVANAPTPDTLRIIALEGQVDDLTKKLTASKKLCDRQQRRLRANWEAKHDGEMATREEIEAWHRSGKGFVIINPPSKILPKGHSYWIPATRGNLKL